MSPPSACAPIENFSPRVVEQFGLDYESLVALKPDVIQVRMPGFGLQGPWRDYVGWAFNFEQTSGMAAVTGYADGPPCVLQGPADPIVGVHAGVALLAALEHRRRTGEGQLIEIAQIEVAACLAAEPVIEYSMNGVVTPRDGNRQRGYLQGVYPTAVDGAWVAISVCDDVGLDHDAFDEAVAAWTSTLAPSDVIDILDAQGVSAEQVLTAEGMYDVPVLEARNYYQSLEHPDHRRPPVSGLALPHHAGTGRPPSVPAANARAAQQRGAGRPRLDGRRNPRLARAQGDRRESAQRVARAASTSDQYRCSLSVSSLDVIAPNAAASRMNRAGASGSASGPCSRKQLGASGPKSNARRRFGQSSRSGSTPAALANDIATRFIRLF